MTAEGLAPYIPLEVLFGNPQHGHPRISPDGKRLAYLAPLDGVLNVWVGPIDGEGVRPVTHDTDRGIQNFFFAFDNRHLLYLRDHDGDEQWRLFAIDLQTDGEKNLTPLDDVQVQLLGHVPESPSKVLLGINKDNPELHDGYILDLETGSLDKTFANPGYVSSPDLGSLVADRALQIRAASRVKSDGGTEILARATPDADWETVADLHPDDGFLNQVLEFSRDGDALFLLSAEGAATTRLVKLHLRTRQTTVIAEDPEYDVFAAMGGYEVIFDPHTSEPQLVPMVKDRMTYIVVDESIAADVTAIRQLHEGDFVLAARTEDDRTWIITFFSDQEPGAHYLYDRAEKQARFLFETKPDLRDYTLAREEPFSYQARDGLTIHGYLMFPPAVERRNLPTLMFPHGGPWSRDLWEFDPWIQWAANRGYLVVLPQFRGSAGYGKAFLNAGDREWGGKMHDDIIDATDWVISKGYADPDRIGIMGGSYGGYATLAAATLTPDRYVCAVDIVGPSNLVTFLDSIPPYWEPVRAMLYRRVGQDNEFLWARSPLSRVDDIRIPMMVVQGANDPRVKQAESEQIVAALRERGIDHDYLLFDDEGHGFVKPENYVKCLGRAEQFLAKHLGGRVGE